AELVAADAENVAGSSLHPDIVSGVGLPGRQVQGEVAAARVTGGDRGDDLLRGIEHRQLRGEQADARRLQLDRGGPLVELDLVIIDVAEGGDIGGHQPPRGAEQNQGGGGGGGGGGGRRRLRPWAGAGRGRRVRGG